ncbi:MAG TPA: polysaccharide biosynthesis protein [Rhodanobacteraceae bacterium]|nr:polysaccharide biosynthesis protein [Rhodanobacteraceae bacterium]
MNTVEPEPAMRDDSAPTPLDPLQRRVSSARSIALMGEVQSLAPAQLEARRLIHREYAASSMTDAFREIRTRLLELSDGQNFTTLVVPMSKGSGGSFIARNLALSFAFDPAKTALLIDCDLRHPCQGQAFGIDADHHGLTDYLEDPALGIEPILHHTGVPRLRVIPAGPQTEVQEEYLSSFRMRAVVDSLRCRYPDRYLFLDGPPIKGAPDARILSDLADFVVVVVGYGRDSAAAVNQAVAGFDPAKLAGLVFNELP